MSDSLRGIYHSTKLLAFVNSNLQSSVLLRTTKQTRTCSRNRTPAQGNAACIGSNYAAASPICLKLVYSSNDFIHKIAKDNDLSVIFGMPLPFCKTYRLLLLHDFRQRFQNIQFIRLGEVDKLPVFWAEFIHSPLPRFFLRLEQDSRARCLIQRAMS